jgi:hypothetical protein
MTCSIFLALNCERASFRFGENAMLKKFRADMQSRRASRTEISRLREETSRLQAEVQKLTVGLHFPPGHYYSPIANLDEIRLHHDAIFDKIPRELPAIDLREAQQSELFNQWKPYFPEADFPTTKQKGRRYYTPNGWYPYEDAVVLFCMMRHFRPARIIEVGSGFSSCVILDANERFFENQIQCTFIEPEPERFLQAISREDRERVNLLCQDVRSIEPEHFQSLSRGDILLIDSSHVSKINSDVNYLLFHVLPLLQSGVLVHFHDIFYPFEYPAPWVYEGWSWNETYLLRAFLQYNQTFRICFFNSFWRRFHADEIQATIPRALNEGGGSLWLQKV